VAAKGWAKWATAQGLTSVLVCVGIAFSSYIVAVVGLIHVYFYFTDNARRSVVLITEEGIEKVCDKSLWRVNDNF
jgi:hypothetical protein